MADRSKFEEMLERLINEDKDGAEELFHEIVVEKSRDIYEGLLETDLDDLEEETDEDDDEVEEGSYKKKKMKKEEDDEDVSEDFDLDEFEVEGDDDMGMGGDPTDDMMSDLEGGDDDEGDDMDMDDQEGEDGMEDRVEDLEDALDDLKAEFEKMMAGEDGEEDSEGDADMDVDMDVDAGDDDGEDETEEESLYFGEAEDDEEEDDEDMDEGSEKKSDTETMREYVEKVSGGGLDASKIGGDNGANAKSTVAGKNDMGGTAANIVSGGESKGEGTKGGLADTSTKEEDAGNINVPGGKASKSMKAQPKGHGAEKKGQGETAANKKSTIGSR